MAISLSSLKSTKRNDPPITLLYGVDGIGKTSLAAEFPNPIYLFTDGERPPSDIDLPTPTNEGGDPVALSSFKDVLDWFALLLTEQHEYGTVIVDSLDGLEPLVDATTATRIGASSVTDNSKGSPAAFGNGIVETRVEWGEFMAACSALSRAGIYVVLLVHPEIKRFDSPVTDPYDRYIVKLNKHASAVVRERCDVVGFLNRRVSLKTKEVGMRKEVTHAEGGKEVQIHLNEGAGFLAKNRYGMPDAVQYRKGQGFTELAKYWPGGANLDDIIGATPPQSAT